MKAAFVLVVATYTVVCQVGGADAITAPDLSLDTIPIGYFGGVNCKQRSQQNIEMLAKMRVIVIEKWEGPCWYECFKNLTMNPPIPCEPSCGAEYYQLKTITQAKAVNPKLSAVFYLNTLYDFPFLELHEKALQAKADMLDVKGKPVAFKNDNGMPNINVFDFSQQVGRDLWTGFVKNLTETGVVDGLFDDKSQILATWNETGKFWQICEFGTGKDTWNISCGVITNETAMGYNRGKPMVLEALYEMFGPTGVVFFHTMDMVNMRDASPLQLARRIQEALNTSRYVYVQTHDLMDGDCTSVQSLCSQQQLAMFLLAVEQGAILGCDGWDEQFSKALGDPLGPAEKTGNMLERHFKSGTYVTWDLSNNQSKIFWADSKSDYNPDQL